MATKRLTKAQVITQLSELTELDKRTVNNVFDQLNSLIEKELSPEGASEFVIPGLVKLRVVKKAATKARPGINPKTGEKITIAAKPASKKVKTTPLKALKDLVVP